MAKKLIRYIAYIPVVQLLRFCLSRKQRLMVQILTVITLFSIVELSLPKLLQLFIDTLTGQPAAFVVEHFPFLIERLGLILWFPLLFLSMGCLKWLLSFISISMQGLLAQHGLREVRERVFDSVQRFSFSYHDRTHSGNMISSLVEDLRYLAQFLEQGLFPIIETSIFMILLYIAMAAIHWFAALLASIFLLLTFIFMFWTYKSGYSRIGNTKRLFATMVEHFTESMEGHLVVRAFGLNREHKRSHRKKIKAMHDSTIKEMMMHIRAEHALMFAGFVSLGLIICAVVYSIQQWDWNVSGGTLFMLVYLHRISIEKLRQFTRGMSSLITCMATADRLNNLFISDEILIDGTEKPSFEDLEIETKDISFSYGILPPVLKGISLKIKPGHLIGVVGFTGSGKSTLVQTLSRFYDPSQGSVLLGGHDIQKYPIRELRKNISVVFQDTFLFSCSIRENIAFGNTRAPHSEIIHAAKIACAHKFILSLPHGYDTEIGERGVTLSGGQRQRIGIARALLLNPPILLMDDPTSALDPETEQQIIKDLAKHRKRKTTLIISHRLTVVDWVDHVFVLDQGRIVDQGTPEYLAQHSECFNQIMKASLKTA